MSEGVGVVGRRVVCVDEVVLLLEVHSWVVVVGRIRWDWEPWRVGVRRESEGLAAWHAAPGDEGVVMCRERILSVPPLTHKII